MLTPSSQGLQIFLPFQNLPSRSLKDYYQLIKDPMSLAAIQKKVRGVIGREAPTGHTLFKSWDAFEDAFSLIWKNARIYNEDGSDIYNLSLELEVRSLFLLPRCVILTSTGNLQQETRRSQIQSQRANAAKTEAQHV
jgi:hypothetical protein